MTDSRVQAQSKRSDARSWRSNRLTRPDRGALPGPGMVLLSERLEGFGDAVFATDFSGTVVGWNRAAGRVLGQRPGNVLGRRCDAILGCAQPRGRRFSPVDCPLLVAISREEAIRHLEVTLSDGRGARVSAIVWPFVWCCNCLRGDVLIHVLETGSVLDANTAWSRASPTALGSSPRSNEGLDTRASGDPFLYYAKLRRVRDYVALHYGDPIPLGVAASVARMERTYFSRFFREKVGIGFHGWLARIRITEAKRTLATSDDSITSVAFAVGFRDLGTFERNFKIWTGLTPLAFKQSREPR